MKKNCNCFRFVLIFLISIMLYSCNNSTTEKSTNEEISDIEEISSELKYTLDITQHPVFTVVPYNQSATLLCKAETNYNNSVSYQWFKCENMLGSNAELINGATSETYETPVFTEKEIRYYYCVTKVGPEKKQSNIAAVAYTGLPIVKVNTGEVTLSQVTKTAYVACDFVFIKDNVTSTYSLTKKGIKGRGNTSWEMPKKGYNLNFDEKVSFFGLEKSKKWCLIANYNDKTLLRNWYASFLGNYVFDNEYNPSINSVDLIVNNEYIGNYTFAEKIDIGKGRVDIQNIADVEKKMNQPNSINDSNNDNIRNLLDGGFILEIDARHDADFYFNTQRGVPFTLKDPDSISDETKQHIKELVQNIEDILWSDNFNNLNSTNQSIWMNYLDIDSFVDWYIVSEFSKLLDVLYPTSVYMYYNPKDGKLHAGPNWDFDIAFGNIYYSFIDGINCGDPEGFYVNQYGSCTGYYYDWIFRLFQDSCFKEHIKNRWNEKRDILKNSFTSDSSILKTMAEKNNTSANLNFLKWNILGTYVWPNPAGYETRTTYKSEIDYLINWLAERFTWLDSAINEF